MDQPTPSRGRCTKTKNDRPPVELLSLLLYGVFSFPGPGASLVNLNVLRRLDPQRPQLPRDPLQHEHRSILSDAPVFRLLGVKVGHGTPSTRCRFRDPAPVARPLSFFTVLLLFLHPCDGRKSNERWRRRGVPQSVNAPSHDGRLPTSSLPRRQADFNQQNQRCVSSALRRAANAGLLTEGIA